MASAKKSEKIVTTDGVTAAIVNGYKLEAIPMPTGGGDGRGAPRKYPFGDMKPGLSFEIVGDKAANNVRNAASKFQAGNPNTAFSIRAMQGEDGKTLTREGQKVYRCFCVEPKASNG